MQDARYKIQDWSFNKMSSPVSCITHYGKICGRPPALVLSLEKPPHRAPGQGFLSPAATKSGRLFDAGQDRARPLCGPIVKSAPAFVLLPLHPPGDCFPQSDPPHCPALRHRNRSLPQPLRGPTSRECPSASPSANFQFGQHPPRIPSFYSDKINPWMPGSGLHQQGRRIFFSRNRNPSLRGFQKLPRPARTVGPLPAVLASHEPHFGPAFAAHSFEPSKTAPPLSDGGNLPKQAPGA